MKNWLLTLVFLTTPIFSTLPLNQGWQEISGRDAISFQRQPLYRVKVPLHWKRHDIKGSIIDTMLPLCEFEIDDEGLAKVTIHNFPSTSISLRVPASAQIHRWTQQLKITNPLDFSVTHLSKGGFIGLYLQAANASDSILAWAMQMAEEHYHHINAIASDNKAHLWQQQMCADYTIKAFGPKKVVERYKDEIESFAASFELIEAIPTR